MKTELNLISPDGGELIVLVVLPEFTAEFINHANRLSSIQINERNICDLELLACRAFSPLRSFLIRADFENAAGEMRL